MALPLPKVIADVGPGGGLVTAMGGMNSLANDMILRKINQIKAQYMPLTTQAEAASKLAYANLMGPQFLAKLLGNDAAVANMGDSNAKAALGQALKAGMGSGNGMNFLNQIQQSQMGPGEKIGNSLSNFFSDKLRGVFGESNPMANMGQPNAGVDNVLKGIAHVESEGSKNPYQLIGRDTGKGDHALGKYQVLASNVPEWTKEALGHSMSPQEFLQSPEAQERVAQYMVNKHMKAGYSPQDIGSIWFTGKPLAQAGNVRDAYGTTVPQYINKMNEGMGRDKTYGEKAGEYKGLLSEGQEAGKIRATSRKELDQDYQQALQLKQPFEKLNEIISNPKFQNLRNIPGFQKLQLDAKANFGTKEEQDLIGQFQAAARNVVAATVKGFGGRILASEIPLSESMKLADKDSIGVMMGKAPVIEAFNEFTLQRARLASQLMKEYHLDKGEALEQADKMVDGRAIRNKIEQQLHPISEEDIQETMKVMNMSRDQVIQRLIKEGRYNG